MFRKIPLVLFLGGAVAVGPGSPAEAPGRWWIRIEGGREVLAIGEVERRDGLVLYRTPTGVLASIPEAGVIGVEAAVPRGTLAAAECDDRPGGAAPDVVTYTNDDLPTAPLPWQASFERAAGPSRESAEDDPDAAGGAAEAGAETPPLTYAAYRDRDGHDETWWRDLSAEIDAERDEARGESEIWTRRYKSLSDLVAIECVGRRFATYLPAVCADYVRLQRDAAQRAEDARAWLEEVEARRRSLSDDARRAGALPGWLR